MSQKEEEETDDETLSRAERLTDRRSRSRERISESTESEMEDAGTNSQSGQSGESGNTGQTGQTNQTEQTGPSGEGGEDGQDGQGGESGKDGDTGTWAQTGDENVKRENVPVYMYLDPRQRDRLLEVFEDAKYHYRKVYDVELQKNRHVYPLVLEHGIEGVREMVDSPTDVRTALEANPYTPVIPSEVDADA